MFQDLPDTKEIQIKSREFSSALIKYNTVSLYMRLESIIAVMVITLQVLSVLHIVHRYQYHDAFSLMGTFLITYLATDFFNGLVHMIVDNNTNYTSIWGPFVAAFHLHHAKLNYTEKHPVRIYFTESGHKFWLLIYLLILTSTQNFIYLNPDLNLGLVLFGILSSLAELSHYWCHNPPKNNSLIRFLQKHHVLLSFKHHRLHHIQDNRNYAFLNGVSDFLLNKIARHCYKGYKNHSDKHVAIHLKNLVSQQD